MGEQRAAKLRAGRGSLAGRGTEGAVGVQSEVEWGKASRSCCGGRHEVKKRGAGDAGAPVRARRKKEPANHDGLEQRQDDSTAEKERKRDKQCYRHGGDLARFFLARRDLKFAR